MGITKDGIDGEQMLFKFLRKKGFSFFQPDAIGRKDGKEYVFECKHQARYTPPPFEGHGLPQWQVTARLEFQERSGVIAILVIFDKLTKEVFYQRFDKLIKGECYHTKGKEPRVIFPLTSFIKISSVDN
jgi:hypothetical protein